MDVRRPPQSHHTPPFSATNLRVCPSELLEATFANPSNGLSSYGEDNGLIVVAIWCLVSQGDMQLWPWWCDADRGRSCPGVALAAEDVELPSGDTHHVSRYATPAVTTNRTYFAPFILEQMGRQAYDADGEPMPGLSDLLERLECWAEGGCCGTGSSKPESESGPTDTRDTTDCHSDYTLTGACEASDGCELKAARSDTWAVTYEDFFEIFNAGQDWEKGQLTSNCISGFDFVGNGALEAGRQYFMVDAGQCAYCTEIVPIGAFECSCDNGWGWDDAPNRPRAVSQTVSACNPQGGRRV